LKILKYNIVVQKIEKEYLILISPRNSQEGEGLTSLVTDKAKLTSYIRGKEARQKLFTNQCELKFIPKE
jgi:hypothetical protein